MTADVIHPIEGPELLLRNGFVFLPDSPNNLRTFCCFSVKSIRFSDAIFPDDYIFWKLSVVMVCWNFLYTIDVRFQVGILSILFEGAKFKTQHWPICLVIQKNEILRSYASVEFDIWLSIMDCFLHWNLPSTSGQTLNEGVCDPNSSIRVLVIFG